MVSRRESELFQKGQEIKPIRLTVVGKHISIADYSLFATIADSKGFITLTNGYHLDGSKDVYLKLRVETGPKTGVKITPQCLKHA
nr:hypothetical protein BCU00_11635 [Vibrio breoganii]